MSDRDNVVLLPAANTFSVVDGAARQTSPGPATSIHPRVAVQIKCGLLEAVDLRRYRCYPPFADREALECRYVTKECPLLAAQGFASVYLSRHGRP